MYKLEGGVRATNEEFYQINTETVQILGDIFSSPEDVYASFTAPQDVDLDHIDPLDLQAHHIAQMQAQRKSLLEALELLQVSENMRNPVMYFEGITSSFFDHCGRDRTVWSRASYIDTKVVESAHTATFRRDQFGLAEPQMQGRIGYVDGQPEFFELATDLQRSRRGHAYRFYSSPKTGLTIHEYPVQGYKGGETRDITDKFERFTLLQALSVDMHAAVKAMKPENDHRVHRLVSLQVYGTR